MTPTDEYYQSKWKSIVKVMTSQNLNVAKIAKAGSRARQQQTSKSDLDVIFSVSDNPSKQNFYPNLDKVLKANFPNDQVKLGDDKNVVHLFPSKGGKLDIVLLESIKFDKEHGDNVEYKKNNL